MTDSVSVRSYAKVNWTLDALFKREDGYHELRTIYQTVSLHDDIRISLTDGEVAISCNDPIVPRDSTNLAHKAALALRDTAGARTGALIQIEKRIPVGAGLGGGSSNAAATLMGLCRLWGCEVSYADLVILAAALGSDVPFFLVGGTAVGIGRGEEVYPTETVELHEIVLVNPGFSVSTREVYEKLSRLTRLESARIMPFTLLAAKRISDAAFSGKNDLEEVAVRIHPEIGELKAKLLELGARHSMMCGSGATVFGVFDNDRASEEAVAVFRSAGMWAERVRTVSGKEYQDSVIETD